MYEELIKELRDYAAVRKGEIAELTGKAADAIEQLEAAVPKWIRFKTRPMDEEERREYSERFGYELTEDEAVIYCSQLPEDGEEVLVCDKYGHEWKDTFDNDPDYGCGFEENGDMDGLVAWMPLPEPPKEEAAEWAVPALRAVLMIIDEMPTIIPADKEGEG